MKKVLLSTLLAAAMVAGVSNMAQAGQEGSDYSDTANVVVTGELPVVATVTSTVHTGNANIDAFSGALDIAMLSEFKVLTNNPTGKYTANFDYMVNTSDAGNISGFYGTDSRGRGGGIGVLTNSSLLPTKSEVENALGLNGTLDPKNNNNAIAYNVFFAQHGGMDPNFASDKRSLNRTTESGRPWQVHVGRDNKNPIEGTYNYPGDKAGTYQATVTCTVAPAL